MTNKAPSKKCPVCEYMAPPRLFICRCGYNFDVPYERTRRQPLTKVMSKEEFHKTLDAIKQSLSEPKK